MKIIRPSAFASLMLGLALVSLCAGCSTDNLTDSSAGSVVKNPAAAEPNNIVPAVGTAGNGGGVSGGGAGAATGN